MMLAPSKESFETACEVQMLYAETASAVKDYPHESPVALPRAPEQDGMPGSPLEADSITCKDGNAPLEMQYFLCLDAENLHEVLSGLCILRELMIYIRRVDPDYVLHPCHYFKCNSRAGFRGLVASLLGYHRLTMLRCKNVVHSPGAFNLLLNLLFNTDECINSFQCQSIAIVDHPNLDNAVYVVLAASLLNVNDSYFLGPKAILSPSTNTPHGTNS